MAWRTPTIDYYGTLIDGRTEPDLRQAMIDTLEGAYPEIAKGQRMLLRKFRRDSDGEMVPCACVDIATREPDKERFCPISHAEKYYWDETWVLAYKTNLEDNFGMARATVTQQAGLINVPVAAFFLRYDVDLTEDDKLIEINLDDEGQLAYPLKRTAIWRISQLNTYRADNGRIEYFKATCSREYPRYLNPPTN